MCTAQPVLAKFEIMERQINYLVRVIRQVEVTFLDMAAVTETGSRPQCAASLLASADEVIE